MNQPGLEQKDVNAVPRFANINPFMRASYKESAHGLDIAMFGVPFDLGSSNRTGARHGPAQMREMSRLIRQIHYPSMIDPFNDYRIADIGDAPINSLSIPESLERIENFVQQIVDAGALPLAAGGDHTISLPILRAVAKKAPLSLIQIDAHSDTLDLMLGQKYANGTPFRRAIEEGLIIPKRMIQVGIRGTLFKADEIDWAIQQGVHIINMDDFYEMGMNGVIEKIRQVVGKSATYLTFDIDSVDPAFAPATGGLEPGGLTSREAQVLLRGLSGINFVGADINEVSPPLDSSNITALLACNLMFEQLCLLTESLNSDD